MRTWKRKTHIFAAVLLAVFVCFFTGCHSGSPFPGVESDSKESKESKEEGQSVLQSSSETEYSSDSISSESASEPSAWKVGFTEELGRTLGPDGKILVDEEGLLEACLIGLVQKAGDVFASEGKGKTENFAAVEGYIMWPYGSRDDSSQVCWIRGGDLYLLDENGELFKSYDIHVLWKEGNGDYSSIYEYLYFPFVRDTRGRVISDIANIDYFYQYYEEQQVSKNTVVRMNGEFRWSVSEEGRELHLEHRVVDSWDSLLVYMMMDFLKDYSQMSGEWSFEAWLVDCNSSPYREETFSPEYWVCLENGEVRKLRGSYREDSTLNVMYTYTDITEDSVLTDEVKSQSYVHLQAKIDFGFMENRDEKAAGLKSEDNN